MCHRCGTAWQKAWTRPFGSYRASVVLAKTTPEVPERQRHCARRDRAHAHRVGRCRHRRHHPRAGHQTGGASSGLADDPGHFRPLVRPWQPRSIDLQGVHDLGRPISRGEIEQQRAGAVRLVQRVIAGEPQAQVVLGQQHVPDPAPDVWFVLADPHQLGRGQAGHGVVAGDLDEALGTDCGADEVALARSALVVPQDRRSEHLVRFVEHDQSVHLAGEPNCSNR